MAARMHHIPAGEARELPADEAWRSLFDDFCLWESEPTQPMPLALEPLSDDEMRREIERVFGGGA